MKDPRLAFFYSLIVPGLGQLYLDERAKGWTLLCMAVGAVVGLIVNHSVVACLLMGGIYLAVMIPAALDAFRTASGHPRKFVSNTVPYVIMMLLVIGPFAIPLLWQSDKFSKVAKIAWTLGIILIAFLAVTVTVFLAPVLEQFVKEGGMV